PEVVRDVRQKLRLQAVARAQLGDLDQRIPELRLQGRHATVRGSHRYPIRGVINPAHALMLSSETACANSPSSASIESSSCCRFSSAQYRPPAANSSACRPCSTICPPSN